MAEVMNVVPIILTMGTDVDTSSKTPHGHWEPSGLAGLVRDSPFLLSFSLNSQINSSFSGDGFPHTPVDELPTESPRRSRGRESLGED